MTITGYKLTGSSATFSRVSSEQLTLLHDTYGDSALDTEITVRDFYLANSALPYPGRQYPGALNYYCDSLRTTRQGDTDPGSQVWRTTFTYSPLYELWRGQTEGGVYTEDPLQAKREIRFGWAERTVDASLAVFEGTVQVTKATGAISAPDNMPFGVPAPTDPPDFVKPKGDQGASDQLGKICASNGKSYDQPLDQRKVDMVMRIKVFQSLIDTTWRDRFDMVNKDTLNLDQTLTGISETFLPTTLLFHNYESVTRYLNGTYYQEVDFEFWYRQGGWHQDIVDKHLAANAKTSTPDGKGGTYQSALNQGEAPTRAILDRDQNPLATETLLDGRGQPNQNDAVDFYNRYRVNIRDELQNLPVGFTVPAP